ncbi:MULTISPECIES: hypothetical protein [Halobacillus]|uniref:Uncharacterized protein n=2 Tax=Halobacillus TaxID=45667 RepID=A0A3D8VST5_9BACI|nr:MULTISPECIES: hypothetical protein [Halobacillus]RDY72350.1 hypothetical protein DXT76_03085 [Halobacillus trueperi]REJ09311.1 hypothetical protein DYE48_09445 [Halobacillus trueperi]SDP79814.1 hypothetical protein SAMN05421677_13915 [Halobacillus aidingensis]
MKRILEDDVVFHFVIALVGLISGILHFLFKWSFYAEHEYLTSGLWFVSGAFVIYVSCIFVFGYQKKANAGNKEME